MPRPRKLPDEAYSFWIQLGDERTYQAVADKFGVHVRTVTNRAKAESWVDRLAKVESKADKIVDQQAAETIAAMRTRHIRQLKAVQIQAIQALRTHKFKNAHTAARALTDTMKLELLVRGEATDRSEVTTIEQQIRKEYDRWMVVNDPDADPDPKEESA